MFEQRSSELEIMDDLEMGGDVIGQTLLELDIINRRLGGNNISLSAFKKLINKYQIKTLADLGCGGGDLLIGMAKIAKNEKKAIHFTGIDANPHIAEYARNHTAEWGNIDFKAQNIFSDDFRKSQFDVVHCCLFLHHFTEAQLIQIFKHLKDQTRTAIIFNDLHRHWLAYYSIKIITHLFSKSYMVRNDAAISVARGFKKEEIIKLMTASNIKNYTLKWRWAFRWELIIQL
ncbi:MAG: methyltransferase domain-containing protein [Cyclobacteriaceae bacterium]